MIKKASNHHLVFTAAISVVFLVLTFFAKADPYFSFDLRISTSVQQFHPSWFDLLMKFITQLGNQALGGAVLLLAISTLVVVCKYKEAFLLIVSSVGAVQLSEFFKMIVSRPRPDPMLISQFEQFTRYDSYPSGHVMFEVSFYGFLLFLVYRQLKKNTWYRRMLLVTFFLPIALIGLSRIYLGAHWFSDVVGGYLLASIWLYLVIHCYLRWSNQP